LKEINLLPNKKIYFASDFHLGAPDHEKSLVREKKICRWLDQIKHDAQVVFLVGDLFDFWFEYRRSVPKGYVRFFGKLAELTDTGIELVVFTGNHDMWMRDYFQQNFNAPTFRESQEYNINGKRFLVGHGDGLGPGDYAYKNLKKVFENKICRWLFANLLHSDLSLKLGYTWASHSWQKHDKEKDVYVFESTDKEILFQYCLEEEKTTHRDFYIFGHRHYKFDLELNTNSRYINLGDWIYFYSYACFDGEKLELKDFKED
jgi:UDP-2,3-diacylglucosamine hydrolase